MLYRIKQRGNDNMKVFVLTKKNLIAAGLILAVIILAVVLAIVFSDRSTDPNVGAVPSPDPNAQIGNEVESYELAVFAGLQKELPVYSVSREDKKIALTIDAAWADDKTEFILETLNKYNIKATFFLCGFWAEKYPDIVKRIDAEGHQIGNHTATHPHMNKLSSQQILDELKKYDDILESIIGKRSTLFRAPYGEYNDNVITTVRNAGYEVIQWDIDTVDWREERSAETILNSVLPKLKSGSIILSHNNGFRIEQYLPTLIETALGQGYEFVTVGELLLDGATIIDVNGVQKPAN